MLPRTPDASVVLHFNWYMDHYAVTMDLYFSCSTGMGGNPTNKYSIQHTYLQQV